MNNFTIDMQDYSDFRMFIRDYVIGDMQRLNYYNKLNDWYTDLNANCKDIDTTFLTKIERYFNIYDKSISYSFNDAMIDFADLYGEQSAWEMITYIIYDSKPTVYIVAVIIEQLINSIFINSIVYMENKDKELTVDIILELGNELRAMSFVD